MHPTSLELIDHIDRRLGSERRRAVDAHLATGCDRCGRRREAYRQLIGALREGGLDGPSAEVVEAAIALFAPGRATCAWGVLVFDSWHHRSTSRAGAPSERRLRFEGEGMELDLRLDRRGPHLRVAGQALRVVREISPLAGAGWSLWLGGREVRRGRCDEDGEFAAEIALGPAPTPPVTGEMQLILHRRGRDVRFRLPD